MAVKSTSKNSDKIHIPVMMASSWPAEADLGAYCFKFYNASTPKGEAIKNGCAHDPSLSQA